MDAWNGIKYWHTHILKTFRVDFHLFVILPESFLDHFLETQSSKWRSVSLENINFRNVKITLEDIKRLKSLLEVLWQSVFLESIAKVFKGRTWNWRVCIQLVSKVVQHLSIMEVRRRKQKASTSIWENTVFKTMKIQLFNLLRYLDNKLIRYN